MNSPVMQKAYNEGFEAVKNGESCPYISGQKVFHAWIDGFVDGVEKPEDIPEKAETSLEEYVLGRCFRKFGIYPYGYPSTGRVFSGYLDQRDRER